MGQISCNACGKVFSCWAAQSPMIQDELWTQVLSHFGLTEDKQNGESTVKFCCYDCMEKALERKLTVKDIKDVPFNIYFRLHYFFQIPLDAIIEIHDMAKGYVRKMPTFKSIQLQKEFAFMSGVLTAFAVKINTGLHNCTDKELREELRRRVDERKAANVVLRCRDCKHCGQGCCKQSSRYRTSVCFLKPKPQAGQGRYYATRHSDKACENFEKK